MSHPQVIKAGDVYSLAAVLYKVMLQKGAVVGWQGSRLKFK